MRILELRVLPLRYCTTRFASRALPSGGQVADLVTEGGEDVRLVHGASYAGIGSGADAASGGAGGLLGWRTWS